MHSISIGSWDTSPFKPVFIKCPADHLCLDFVTSTRRSTEWQGAPNLLHLLRTHKLAKEIRIETMSQELIYINRPFQLLRLAGVSHLWLGKDRRTRRRGKIIRKAVAFAAALIATWHQRAIWVRPWSQHWWERIVLGTFTVTSDPYQVILSLPDLLVVVLRFFAMLASDVWFYADIAASFSPFSPQFSLQYPLKWPGYDVESSSILQTESSAQMDIRHLVSLVLQKPHTSVFLSNFFRWWIFDRWPLVTITTTPSCIDNVLAGDYKCLLHHKRYVIKCVLD